MSVGLNYLQMTHARCANESKPQSQSVLSTSDKVPILTVSPKIPYVLDVKLFFMGNVIADRVTGTVTSYHSDDGYGFATTLDLDDNKGAAHDIFFHISDVRGMGIEEGWRFEFDVEETPDGYRAKDIQIISKNTEKESKQELKKDRMLKNRKSKSIDETRDPLSKVHSSKKDDNQDEDDEQEESPFSDDIRGSKNDLI